MADTNDTEAQAVYEIRVKNHLDNCWSGWFKDMIVTNVENGEVILSGTFMDQTALFGLLEKIRDLNLTLIYVKRIH